MTEILTPDLSPAELAEASILAAPDCERITLWDSDTLTAYGVQSLTLGQRVRHVPTYADDGSGQITCNGVQDYVEGYTPVAQIAHGIVRTDCG